LASRATSGLTGAIGIVKLEELLVEFFALAVGESVAARSILGGDDRAGSRFISLPFLPLQDVTLAAGSGSSRRKGEMARWHRAIVTPVLGLVCRLFRITAT
jgi:hypothetical protein